ncbi:uncharacterized protein TRUGW13939_05991 [Talaromyces rugulosus]|uniref:Uncharacterized protein n=1 Tax=Talaromyces rugulosus TaxID=121627 RepID=A0A7H8R1V9_TALRU|nr:uncharacterized protein TRUGW13939_05991 [Talaromyces rugulosus]QKX58863.1 hypothetical protein TRUGW13939_05991 [Talaromyces rugulosus]
MGQPLSCAIPPIVLVQLERPQPFGPTGPLAGYGSGEEDRVLPTKNDGTPCPVPDYVKKLSFWSKHGYLPNQPPGSADHPIEIAYSEEKDGETA